MTGRTLVLAALAAAAAAVFFMQRGAGPLFVEDSRGKGIQAAARNNDEGLRMLESGDIDGAVGRFREALSADPYNEVLRRNLSVSLSRKAAGGNDSGGSREGLLAEALSLWPENPEALDLMSAIHFKAGRYREAWDLAARLAAFYPDRPGLAAYVRRLEIYLEEEKGMVREGGHFFRLQYSGERQLEFEGEITAVFQDQMDELASYLGVFPEEPIDILMLTEELGEAAVPVDPSVTGLYDGRIRLYLGKELPPRGELVGTARHELVHALLNRAGRVPSWFHEGLAQILGEEPSAAMLGRLEGGLRQAMEEGWVLDLESLEDTFLPLPVKERSTAYAASLLYVRYLMDRYGRNLPPILVAELQRGGEFAQVLRSVTGKEQRELQDDFINRLKRGG